MATSPADGEKKDRDVAEELFVLANVGYEIVVAQNKEVLAYPLRGAKIAKTLSGGHNSLSNQLTKKYRETERIIPSEYHVKAAIRVLASYASDKDPVAIYTRYAYVNNTIYIDLGDATGAAVEIDGKGWRVIESPSVYFKRTALTSPLPRPQSGGDIRSLFSIINVQSEDQDVFLGFLVAACFENRPHPILALDGEQGSGKSNTASYTNLLIDPSPALLRPPPRDEKSWLEVAPASYVITLDNVSKISAEISDLLCRASTGDSVVKRELYTNSDVVSHSFRRVIILNGINLGDTRDDLSDRLLTINLPALTPSMKKEESDLQAIWNSEYPKLLGALYDLCSGVIRELAETKLDELPRMADFAKILATLDRINSTTSLARYHDGIMKSAAHLVDNDPFMKAMEEVITATWVGTARELLDVFRASPTMFAYENGFPENPKALTDKLKRSVGTLRKSGWSINDDGARNAKNVLKWTLTPPTRITSMTRVTSTSSEKTIEVSRGTQVWGLPSSPSHTAPTIHHPH